MRAYITLHYITVQYSTVQYTTLHHITYIHTYIYRLVLCLIICSPPAIYKQTQQNHNMQQVSGQG